MLFAQMLLVAAIRDVLSYGLTLKNRTGQLYYFDLVGDVNAWTMMKPWRDVFRNPKKGRRRFRKKMDRYGMFE